MAPKAAAKASKEVDKARQKAKQKVAIAFSARSACMSLILLLH